MGHYLSEMESAEESAERMAHADDVAARRRAGFLPVYDMDNLWRCDTCEAVILGERWKLHKQKAHATPSKKGQS